MGPDPPERWLELGNSAYQRRITQDLTFFYNPQGGAIGFPNTSVITMPPSLLQATGSGPHTWILNDDLGSSETSSLTLLNQGQIFVNDTNTLTRTGTTTNWVFEGDPTPEQAGNQILQNDGEINVIGTTGIGTTTASFFDGATNLTITGSGQINVYGNAIVNFGLGVGVSSSQTVNFVTLGGDTSGTVTEVDATRQDATYGGFLAGDTLVLQNLGGVADSETVVDGNGFATVNIMSGTTLLDSVTFLGNFANGAADFTFDNAGGKYVAIATGQATAYGARRTGIGAGDRLRARPRRHG